MLLKCSSMVHVMNSTAFIFSGVICLTLDPVAQSDCRGPSGKDFQLTKPHSHRVYTSIPPLCNLAPWLPQHTGPITLAPASAMSLSTPTNYQALACFRTVFKTWSALVQVRSALAALGNL